MTPRPLYRQPRRPKGPPEGATPEQIKKYWRNRQSHECRLKRIAVKRHWLIDQLGGPTCRCCQDTVTYDMAEIHHMEGRTWDMKQPQEKRINKMIEEFNANVWLTVLCKSCNSGIGDPRKRRESA